MISLLEKPVLMFLCFDFRCSAKTDRGYDDRVKFDNIDVNHIEKDNTAL